MRPRGEGSVTKDKSGNFVVKVPVGRYPNGSTRYATKRTKSKAEGERLRRQLLSEFSAGRLKAGPKETLRHYAEWYFINEAPVRMRSSTIYNVHHLLDRHIFPALGHRPLTEIQPREITQVLMSLRAKYAATTVNNVRMALSGVFSSAVRNEKLLSNPVAKTQKLQKQWSDTTQVQPAYNEVEVGQLLKAVRGTDLDLFVNLAVYTGMRRGEILGLKWSDIEFGTGQVFISRTLKEGSRLTRDGRGITSPAFNEPKTKAGRRMVHLTEGVIDLLRAHQVEQQVFRELASEAWIHHDLVFCNRSGLPVFPSNWSTRFRSFLKTNGLRHIRIHDLRHTFAQLALSHGVQLAAITQTLGHASFSITKDIYGVSVQALEVEATSTIARIFDPKFIEPDDPRRLLRNHQVMGVDET